jgi:hypothetical protein
MRFAYYAGRRNARIVGAVLEMSKEVPVRREMLFLLAVVFGLALGMAPALRSQSQVKIVQPELVRQGETFKGMVVEETVKGDVPLEGGQVVFRCQVIPIEEGGRIALPPFVKEAGSEFVSAQVIPAAGGAPFSIPMQHVEVVPLAANVPTRIAEAPTIVTSGGTIRITGQSLSALQKAALVHPDASLRRHYLPRHRS